VDVEEHGTAKEDDRRLIREDADKTTAALQLLVEALEWIGRLDLAPVLTREGGVGPSH
jgi:hypothetical protein